MEIKVLPHNIELEEAVLGALMIEKQAYSLVGETLLPETFYVENHQLIYKAINDLAERQEPVDILTVSDQLRKKGELEQVGGPYYITQLSSKVASSAHIEYHANVLHDLAIRRKYFEIGNYLIGKCYSLSDDVFEVQEEARELLDNLFCSSSSSVSTVKDAVEGVYDQIQCNLNGSNHLTGSTTGFSELDKRSGGLQSSDLIVIAAETSTGKTSLALNMVVNSQDKIAFYSMEMKKEQIAARMISMESGVSANEILYSRLTDQQFVKVDKSVAKILRLSVYFDDRSSSNIDTIISSIRSMKIKHGIKGAVVDYLQMLNVNMRTSNKEQQMGEVARRLKNLAKELDIWIIALSQFNRDSANPVPSINRLRDSGQIAEAADVVLLIYRPELHGRSYPKPFENYSTHNTAMIDIAKGRNIGTGKFLLSFQPETTLFHEGAEINTINTGPF